MKDIITVYDAARALGAELTAMSWNGFNLFGDKKSIDELQRLMTMEARATSLQRIIDDMRNREAERSWAGHVDRQSGAFDDSEQRSNEWR